MFCNSFRGFGTAENVHVQETRKWNFIHDQPPKPFPLFMVEEAHVAREEVAKKEVLNEEKQKDVENKKVSKNKKKKKRKKCVHKILPGHLVKVWNEKDRTSWIGPIVVRFAGCIDGKVRVWNDDDPLGFQVHAKRLEIVGEVAPNKEEAMEGEYIQQEKYPPLGGM